MSQHDDTDFGIGPHASDMRAWREREKANLVSRLWEYESRVRRLESDLSEQERRISAIEEHLRRRQRENT